MRTHRRDEPHVAIIGSGFAGICLGIQLKRAGLHSFTILEKADRIGGTWRDNTYPGAACDSPAFAYCFSFEQKTDWSQKWVPHDEILGYMKHCVAKYDLAPHLRLNHEVESGRFDEASGTWQLRFKGGETTSADVVCSGVGQLNRPHYPAIEGLDLFAGESFHSARWRHDYDLTNRRVAVVGNAASAIQFVPEIAPKVQALYLFQRSANWMLPRLNRPFTEAERRRFARLPLWSRLYRWWLWAQYESRFPAFRGNRLFSRHIEAIAIKHLEENVSDPDLRQKLVPQYPIGGKRILISDDYYPVLERENLELVTAGIRQVNRHGIATVDGRSYEVDAIILATGFESTSFLAPMELEGLAGRPLNAAWQGGAEAYLGITVSGFPNFFMMYGPNTNLGHNSILFMLECQARYITDCVQQLGRRRLRYVDVRREVMDAYNAELRRALDKTVWAQTDHSWYKTVDGKITNNWAGPTVSYWWRTRRANLHHYLQAPQTVEALAPAVGEA